MPEGGKARTHGKKRRRRLQPGLAAGGPLLPRAREASCRMWRMRGAETRRATVRGVGEGGSRDETRNGATGEKGGPNAGPNAHHHPVPLQPVEPVPMDCVSAPVEGTVPVESLAVAVDARKAVPVEPVPIDGRDAIDTDTTALPAKRG